MGPRTQLVHSGILTRKTPASVSPSEAKHMLRLGICVKFYRALNPFYHEDRNLNK